jgi:hypothetical protein
MKEINGHTGTNGARRDIRFFSLHSLSLFVGTGSPTSSFLRWDILPSYAGLLRKALSLIKYSA